MTEIVIPYSPRPIQRQLHGNTARWQLTICHRRFGKTVYEINKLIKAALTCDKRAPRYAYIAPFLSQGKAIAWDYLQYYSRSIPGIAINQAELRIDYPNGARIRIYGADNPDSLRGIYLDGVVFDEYAQIAPNLFPEVILPALTDRQGWADLTGTPKGRNHFYDLYEDKKSDPQWSVNIVKASESGIFDAETLADIKRQMNDQDLFDQEYECSWTAATKGAYYADTINAIRDKGQICTIPTETSSVVNTFWDLGMNDTTAIWFHQQVGKEHRFIDYYECNGEALSHYVRILREKGYFYGSHYLPHDAEVRELSTGKSRRQVMLDMGLTNIKVVPRITDVLAGIDMVRQQLPNCWLDSERCDSGIKALENYRKEYDEKRQTFRSRPLHDWASNGADAFRQWAQGYEFAPRQLTKAAPIPNKRAIKWR